METLLILIDSSPFMVLFKDRQGRWIWMNQSFIKEMDLPPREEILGKHTQDLLPESKDLCREDREVVARGEPLLGLLRKVTLPSGRKRWHLTDKIPIKTPGNGVAGVAVFIRDVTEQREAQRKLERLNRVLEAVLDVNQLMVREKLGRNHLLNEICGILVKGQCYESVWIILLDPQTGYLLDVFSLTETKAEIKRCLSPQFVSHLTMDSKDGFSAIKYEDLLRKGWQLPKRYTGKVLISSRLEHGKKTYGVICASLPRNVELEIKEKDLFLTLANDIAYALHKLDVRDELRREKIFWEKLFNVSPEGVVLCAPDGRVLRVNNAFCHIFRFSSPEEVIGKNIDSIVADEITFEEARSFTEAAARGERVSVESVRQRVDGTLIDVSILGIPIKIDEDLAGVYAIYRDITDKKMYERAMKENIATLFRVWRQTIELIASVSELRDPYTAGHQKRVAELAKFMAMKMRLSPESVDAVEMASLIHDVGKIKVPAEILSKPGPLDEVEYLLVKTHPQAGYNLLKDIDFPWPVAEIVLQHHERLDGSGYPQGLKGKEILQEARIIAVADVVEAMASGRPYRKALGIEAALKEIKSGRGTLYDEEAVDACLALFEEGLAIPLFEKVIF
ncbi:HD domain-containing phosphohydrolase [Acetomicrobium sp.]|uniref:HD domain-containing phosphohydrolase n=1 Tax=Acetomicrobium sp. TaxID=1872099 RepID=UPI0028728738|nr:HD domain-containing phosphohydrolase [Acetomicrobium sp.]MDR9770526.1 PAS domain-containing protein [Acetomicrobium sp.]